VLFHGPGCEPYLGEMEDPACAAHNALVMRSLEQTKSIRTIVISIRQNNPQRVQRAWDTAGALLQRGWRVVFLGPLPEGQKAVAQEWAARELQSRHEIRDVTIPVDAVTRVASYADRLAVWRSEAAAMQARDPAQLIAPDLGPLFCDARQCWLVRDGVGLFRDADHLTDAGAQRVLPAILDAVRPAAR
jgi:hypothetical protein